MQELKDRLVTAWRVLRGQSVLFGVGLGNAVNAHDGDLTVRAASGHVAVCALRKGPLFVSGRSVIG